MYFIEQYFAFHWNSSEMPLAIEPDIDDTVKLDFKVELHILRQLLVLHNIDTIL